MNENSNRSLLIAGLSANVLMLMLTLLDYALADSQYMWPLFVAWAFLILLLVILATATWRASHSPDSTVPLARAVAALASRPIERPVAVAPAPVKPLLEFDAFPFVYNGYTLYSRSVQLNGGGQRTIWFFSKRTPSSGTKAAKPAGYHVGVNERTGLPFLKKGTGADGEDLTPEVEKALRPQCSALTADGKQCRNSAREASKYCASHFGYQPPAIAKAEANRKDTLARVKGAPDTVPSVRRKPAA